MPAYARRFRSLGSRGGRDGYPVCRVAARMPLAARARWVVKVTTDLLLELWSRLSTRRLEESMRMPHPVVLTVTESTDGNVYEFPAEGQVYTFGRDASCGIPIRDASTRLSRVAGSIWRMDDELWVRNLSEEHDLLLRAAGHPPEAPMPLRAAGQRPAARSIPGRRAVILAPDCRLIVRQLAPPYPASTRKSIQAKTESVSAVPEALRPAAQALCLPLFRGLMMPATYAEVALSLGLTERQARRRVDELVDFYKGAVPSLKNRMSERRRTENADLDSLDEPTLTKGGVRKWEPKTGADKAQDGGHGVAENPRSLRAGMLPYYYEVAHMLVRYGLVSPPLSGPGR